MPSAFAQVLGARDPAAYQKQRFPEILAAPDDDPICRKLPNLGEHLADCRFLFRADVVADAQFLEMGFNHPFQTYDRTVVNQPCGI